MTEIHRNILTIDIGGSGIKATILDEHEEMVIPRARVKTPQESTPQNVVAAIKELIQDFPEFDKVAVGFPGYIKKGTVHTAPNLGTRFWKGFPLAKELATLLQKPVRLLNDADLLGLGVIQGEGLELMLTLGTGVGTAFYLDGHLMPHLELSHHPLKKGVDYDHYVGKAALKEIGVKRWNRRVKKILEIQKTVFNYDIMYIGGGNSDKIDFKLDKNMTIVSNHQGIRGGMGVWRLDEDDLCILTAHPNSK